MANFTNATLQCSFSDCFIPCLVTFLIVFVGVAMANLWIYFRLVRLAKQRFGEGFTSGPVKPTQPAEELTKQRNYASVETAFADPYPGMTQLSQVREEELWRLMQTRRECPNQYFNLLSDSFLLTKGLSQEEVDKARESCVRLSMCQN